MVVGMPYPMLLPRISLNPSKWVVRLSIRANQLDQLDQGPVLRNMKVVILLNSYIKVIYKAYSLELSRSI